jgi:hydroxymethylpyrimidine pyrophosphatase-like HAD family hydrolase
VSKGAGLQFVADRLGFTASQTVACGDGENDRELLDWAGFRVAVANAHDDILARADVVVPPVTEEGVAVLLEAYLDSRG